MFNLPIPRVKIYHHDENNRLFEALQFKLVFRLVFLVCLTQTKNLFYINILYYIVLGLNKELKQLFAPPPAVSYRNSVENYFNNLSTRKEEERT